MLTQLAKKVSPFVQFSTDQKTRAEGNHEVHNPEWDRLHSELAWMPGSQAAANPNGLVGEAALYGGKM